MKTALKMRISLDNYQLIYRLKLGFKIDEQNGEETLVDQTVSQTPIFPVRPTDCWIKNCGI